MNKLEEVLTNGGFKVVTGSNAVLEAIEKLADKTEDRLCSGHRVFPDGRECTGCQDCMEGKPS